MLRRLLSLPRPAVKEEGLPLTPRAVSRFLWLLLPLPHLPRAIGSALNAVKHDSAGNSGSNDNDGRYLGLDDCCCRRHANADRCCRRRERDGHVAQHYRRHGTPPVQPPTPTLPPLIMPSYYRGPWTPATLGIARFGHFCFWMTGYFRQQTAQILHRWNPVQLPQ